MRYTWVWLLVAVFAAGCSKTTNTTTESSDMAQGQSNITELQKTDVQVGTGAEAGVAAGNLRDAVGFVVLLPKSGAPAP